MASITSGMDNAVPIQNRRVRSRSSESSAAPVPAIGTRAIPHLGQEPGPSRTISGCMGQVYCAPLIASAGGAGGATGPLLAYFAGSALNADAQCRLQK